MYDHTLRSFDELLTCGLRERLVDWFHKRRHHVVLGVGGAPVVLTYGQARLFLCGMLCTTRL